MARQPQPVNDVGRDGRLTEELVAWLADGHEPDPGGITYLRCAARELKELRAEVASLRAEIALRDDAYLADSDR